MMIWITGMRTSEDERYLAKLGVIAVLSSAFYASASASLISTRFREQVRAELGYVVPLDRFGRMWAAAYRWLVALPGRVRPRLTLVLSSVLTLSTLALQTAQMGCEHHPKAETTTQMKPGAASGTGIQQEGDVAGQGRPGYQILTGDADWPPSLATPMGYAINDRENSYGRILYALSLCLAVFGLGLAAWITRRRAHKIVMYLSRVCAALSVAFLCEFANQSLLLLGVLWPCTLVLTAALYIIARFSLRKAPHRADRIYRSLRMGYVPLLLADVTFLSSGAKTLPGLLVLFLSVHLMTLGYFSASIAGERAGRSLALDVC